MHYLEEALQMKQPDVFQRAGMIQFFEMSFELGWNLLKDYLEEQGFVDVQSPRGALKKAFETGLIKDGHIWMQILDERNRTSHIYDEEKAMEVETLILRHYYDQLKELLNTFKQKTDG